MPRARPVAAAKRRLSAPERSRDSRHSLSASLQAPEETLLDVVDNLLNKGVMLDGDVVLALADDDLIYLRLSVLLSAADRVMRASPTPRPAGANGGQRPRAGRARRR